jgi:RNA polymerase-binding transcription factor DksA
MLTPADLERFRIRLEDDRRRVTAHLRSLRQQLGSPQEPSDREGDEGDDATEIYSSEEIGSEIQREQDQLTQIEDALRRIAEGTYGYSEVSGKPIPVERLEALPTATTLVGEQRAT